MATAGVSARFPLLFAHSGLLVLLGVVAGFAITLGTGPALTAMVAALASVRILAAASPDGVLASAFDDASLLTFVAASVALVLMRHVADLRRDARLERANAAHSLAVEANRAKDEFLALLSHELRGPLHAILGWSDLLKSGLEASDVEIALDSIQRNAQHEAKLVSDILDVSRILFGKLNIVPADVDALPVVEAAVETARPVAETRGIRLELCVDAGSFPLRADAGRLTQVVGNLVGNALKFTPSGGSVRVVLRRSGDCASISVIDDGQGIPAEFLPLLFERYRQAGGHHITSQDGLGLGLSIVHHLVTLHGGTVRASSDGAGRGATFTVELPLRSETVSDAGPAGSAATPAPGDPEGDFAPDTARAIAAAMAVRRTRARIRGPRD